MRARIDKNVRAISLVIIIPPARSNVFLMRVAYGYLLITTCYVLLATGNKITRHDTVLFFLWFLMIVNVPSFGI